MDALWIHDLPSVGAGFETTLGPTSGSIVGCLVERNHHVGVYSTGAVATVEGCVVRDTQRVPVDGTGRSYGWGIDVTKHPNNGDTAEVTVRGSLLERNHAVGMVVTGANTTIEASVVRDTQFDHDGGFGEGIAVEDSNATGQSASFTMRGCLLEQNGQSGVALHGSTGVIETTVIRDTHPTLLGAFGGGVTVQANPATGNRAALTLVSSVVQRNHRTGLFVGGADVTVQKSVVRDTMASPNGLDGDGIAVRLDTRGTGAESSLVLRESRVEHNERAGLSVFGTEATLGRSALGCNAIDLTAELLADVPALLQDDDDNTCGCPGPTGPCRAVSAGLQPPEPI